MAKATEDLEKLLVSSVGLDDASKIQHDLVIKYHLYLELTVVNLLNKYLKDTSKIEKLGFMNKLAVLEATQFFRSRALLLKKIKLINTIRNRFAHSINAKITDQDINQLKNRAKPLVKRLDDYTKLLKEKESFDWEDGPTGSLYESMSKEELNNEYFKMLVGYIIGILHKHLRA